jgi:nitrite reductase/ring-hydroxylating ferredoxin subunit
MTHEAGEQTPSLVDDDADRRGFFSRCLMLLGLGGGYGMFAALAIRYLYPARPDVRGWLYTVELNRLKTGDSFPFVTPAGDNVLITRQGDGASSESFIALSSTCPHLGCKVNWDAVGSRFVCPCHNGTFDLKGKATSGPPAAEGKNLPQYPLRVDNGLLFINVPLHAFPTGTNSPSGTAVAAMSTSPPCRRQRLSHEGEEGIV